MALLSRIFGPQHEGTEFDSLRADILSYVFFFLLVAATFFL